MISYKLAKTYCKDDISLIENYLEAVSDTTQMWVCHHRKEITNKKTKRELITGNEYYNVSASDLIFLTISDHMKLHGENMSEEHKAKISEATTGENNPMFGKNHSEESRRKISETRKARIASGEIVIDTSKCHTPESYTKISAKAKERLSNPENHPMYGKTQSIESRRKISEAKKGKLAWNKGLHNKIFITNGKITKTFDKNLPIPDGWVKGKKNKD